MLGSLSEIATVWSSIATLWAAAAVWWTYYAADKASRLQHHAGLRSTLLGIGKELDLISLWAGPEEDTPGYLKSKHPNEYLRDNPDWRNPGRLIFTFDYPAVKGLTTSEYLTDLEKIIPDFVSLNYSVVRLFNFYEEYRRYVVSRPELYDSVMRKLSGTPPQADLTQPEIDFTLNVFQYNYRIHVDFIGGQDSIDKGCLFKAFRKAKASLRAFDADLKRPEGPWWYWALHLLAAVFVLGGGILFLKWLGCTRLFAQG